jgi:hypothetical protein
LGNSRLTFLLIESLHGFEETQESASSNFFEIDADVCASKFSDYSTDLIQQIDKGLLHDIVNSPRLKLENEDEFVKLLIHLGEAYFEFWQYIEIRNLTGDGILLFVEHLPFDELTESIWQHIVDHLKDSKGCDFDSRRYLSVVGFESMIAKYYPNILNEFVNKTWKLLYRGSRDGFRVSNFHGKCDNQSNTLTLIETTKGFIFGGFTPVVWDSTTNGYKSDSSQKSFLFTLKNSRKSEPRKFKLLNASSAIVSNSGCGPTFGNGHDIYVADNCNTSTSNSTNLGSGYVNDTGIDGKIVFSGEYNFTVKEIEIFTITL